MAIAYKCLAITNPPGPGIVIKVEAKIGTEGVRVFEVPITKQEAANLGALDPVPFARRIARALLLGATPASLIGVTDTE